MADVAPLKDTHDPEWRHSLKPRHRDEGEHRLNLDGKAARTRQRGSGPSRRVKEPSRDSAERSRVGVNDRLPKPVIPRNIVSPLRLPAAPLPRKQPNAKGTADRNAQPEQRIAPRAVQPRAHPFHLEWYRERRRRRPGVRHMSKSKGYDLALRGEFPCRVLPIGRATRVVTASLLRVLESGEPEYNGTPITRTDRS
ncbi:hypothetical protein HEK131_45170 [Streptomyces seoulensis]|nr:hypothetical protein HEK131_45170 [Streptomyces seoulensis]